MTKRADRPPAKSAPLELAGGVFAASIAVSSSRSAWLNSTDNVHSCFASLSEAGTNPAMSQKSGTRFTEKQGHYLAFIHTYAYMFGRHPPKPTSSATSVSARLRSTEMIVTLERNAFIRRQPGVPRSIEILVPPKACQFSNADKRH